MMTIKFIKYANKLAVEYHDIVNELFELKDNDFKRYIDRYERLESKLKFIEKELFAIGFAIDKYHQLHIL